MADPNSYRSVSIPFASGTVQGNAGQSAVALNSTRIVYARCQINPNWKIFTIIDTPEGWASSNGNPVVTANRLQEPGLWGIPSGSTAGSCVGFYMERLNDNAFITMYPTNNSWSVCMVEVWEIDANNVITKATSASVATSTTWSNGSASCSPYHNQMQLIPLSDNKATIVMAPGSAFFGAINLSYNTSTKALTVSGTTQVRMYVGTAYYSELYWHPIPGTTQVFIGNRYTGSSSFPTAFTNGTGATSQTGGTMLDINTQALTNYYPPDVAYCPQNYNTFGAFGLSATRRGVIYNWNAVGYATTPSQYCDNELLTTVATSDYSTIAPASTNVMGCAIPMANNYFWLFDRSGIAVNTTAQAANAVNVKVMRREDTNFTVQSAASGASATGMTIAAPWCNVFWDKLRPRILADGSLYWMGTDSTTVAGTGATKLMWNVIKVPS